jgi:RNA polymerase sigma-B factor
MRVEKVRKLSKEEKRKLIVDNYKLVRKLAYNYSQKSIDPLEDLMQVGFIALLEASENYQDTHNTLFTTYATHYISGHIRHYIRDKQSLMKGPRSLQELSYKANVAIKNLSHKLGRDPDKKEIAKELNVSEDRIDEVKDYETRISIIWLDQSNDFDQDEKSKIENISNEKANDMVEEKILIKEALDKLEPHLRNILEMRYYKDMTQNEISDAFGISQMEVSRKIKKAEKELKQIISL